LKICIEIDWDSHFEDNAIEYDKIRTEYLEMNWIRVIRFTNKEIMENINGVLYELEKYVKDFCRPYLTFI
jgi:very-short-patch-repair endonuclease